MIGELIVNAAALEHMTVAWAAALTRRAAGTCDVKNDREVIDDIWKDVIGQGSAGAVAVCRRRLTSLPAGAFSEDRRLYLQGLLDDIAGLFEHRHAVAHGLWEQDEQGALISFRATRWTKKQPSLVPEDRIIRVGGTPEQLRQLIDQFEDATRDVIEAFRVIWPGEWGTPPEEVRLPERDPSAARRPHGLATQGS